MPRQSRGSAPAPRRPSVPTPQSRSAPQQPTQARQASTSAAPPAQQHAPPPAAAPQQAAPAASGGSGLFGQMASTAAGVAVGSSIGHAVGGWFGGGSSAAAPADQPLATAENGQTTMNSQFEAPKVCAQDVSNFRSCMDQNQGDLTICGWYLDQLKQCQSAASHY